ncbi:extracellular dihydrogeodin oxidase/laccase [Gigaspora margarita]|uniref:Extracellular dihydrogeodin oxidase/laccase n=1 Tax=Gigaspora margarita TaxID=4874 RepID=A0A8H3ZZU8_GIGMA|nr:extracellular dihydrogeodin oxidase/laccase [Gigaspora margarita]
MKFELIFIIFVLISSSNSAWLNRRSQSSECDYVTSDLFKPLEPLPPTDSPVTRCYNLELVVKDLAPDGFTRPVWSINGQSPGPILQANYGDRILINVTNKFGDPASIHWHGIFQNGTNFYDGIVGVTQCEIPDKVTFLYNFTLKQYGTHWYHSHFLAQIVDGLRGPLIIYNPKDPYYGKYDYEYVMTLSDWYHTPTGILLPLFRADTYKGADPIPDSGLISGLGQYDCKAAPKNSTCNSNNKVATYVVKKGKKYRFRIINTSALVHYIFSIDNHPLTIIEVDSELVKPVTLNTIPINIAQRYSVILDANQPIDNYQIRAHISICTPIDNLTINYNSALNYNVTGILKYDGAKDKLPISKAYPLNTSEACRDVNPNSLKPYYEKQVPKNVISTIKALVNFNTLSTGKTVASINNSSFVPDTSYPTNQEIVEGVNPYKLPNYDNAYVYDCNSGDCNDAAVDIYILNNNTDSHPFHLHGHRFYVLYNGENQTGIKPPHKSDFNFKDPVIRDTVTVLPNSTTVIRYNANNPGVWFFHCHIQWHLNMGMAAQMIELPSIFKNTTIPNDVTALCVGDDLDNKSKGNKTK